MSERDANLEQCKTELESSEARFRNIIARSADGIIITDVGGTIRFANPAAEYLFGRKADDLVGQLFGYPVIAGETSELTIVSRKEQQTIIEMRVVETEWEGEQAFVANLRDIAEQKRILEALRESEERYSAMVRASSQVLYSMSPDWSELRQLQGGLFVKDTPRPNRNWLQEYVPPDDQKRVLEAVDQAVRTATVFELEHRVRRVDGTVGWTFSRAIPIRNTDGDIMEWFGAASDITERKKNEEDLKKAMEQVTRINRELEQFAYVASHDLQEPLRMVSSYMQLLLKKYQGKLDEKADVYINYAVDGAKRMQNLIEALLKYSRLSLVEFGWVETAVVVADAVANLTATIQETGAEITSTELPIVWGDRTQLLQLFQNLLSNAIKYRKPGVPPRITVGAGQAELDWLFSVKDNGIGIEQQNFEQVFEIFRRLHTREEIPGTGIGLASCKKIVEQHHGRIWVESTPGEGTIFFFTMPVHAEH